MTALARRWKWAMPVVTFFASIGAALFVLACASALGGCGSAPQRTVSALASASVVADQALSVAYETQAREAIAEVQDAGGDEADWCEAMAEPWERASRAFCAIEALADLAIAGQAAIDAGAELDAEWGSAACATLAAVESAWSSIDADVPQVVGQARALVCALAGGTLSGAPSCAPAGPPPPCPSQKCYASKASSDAVAAVWAVLREVYP